MPQRSDTDSRNFIQRLRIILARKHRVCRGRSFSSVLNVFIDNTCYRSRVEPVRKKKFLSDECLTLHLTRSWKTLNSSVSRIAGRNGKEQRREYEFFRFRWRSRRMDRTVTVNIISKRFKRSAARNRFYVALAFIRWNSFKYRSEYCIKTQGRSGVSSTRICVCVFNSSIVLSSLVLSSRSSQTLTVILLPTRVNILFSASTSAFVSRSPLTISPLYVCFILPHLIVSLVYSRLGENTRDLTNASANYHICALTFYPGALRRNARSLYRNK